MPRRNVVAFVVLFTILQAGCGAFKGGPMYPQMPAEQRETPVRSMDPLRDEIRMFNRVAGGYPPRFQGEDAQEIVYRSWADALADARAYRSIEGDSERVLSMLADLYRQGHNMDVEGAGVAAIETIDACLAKYPRSERCHWTAAYFFLSVAPTAEHLDKAERSLKFLRTRYAPKMSEEVEEAYVYLYVYRRDGQAALKQIARYLSLFPKSPRKPTLEKLRAAVKANKEIYPGTDVIGPTGAWR